MSIVQSIEKVQRRMSRASEADFTRMHESAKIVSGAKRVHYSINSIDDFVRKLQFIEQTHGILANSTEESA